MRSTVARVSSRHFPVSLSGEPLPPPMRAAILTGFTRCAHPFLSIPHPFIYKEDLKKSGKMMGARLIRLVEDHCEELAIGLTQKLRGSKRTSDFRNIPVEELHHTAGSPYRTWERGY